MDWFNHFKAKRKLSCVSSLTLFSLFFVGCATQSPYKNVDNPNSKEYQRALDLAFQSLENINKAGRGIASIGEGSEESLNKINSGLRSMAREFDVLVFPKVNTLTLKSKNYLAQMRKAFLIQKHGKFRGLWKWAAEQVTSKDYFAPIRISFRPLGLGTCEIKGGGTEVKSFPDLGDCLSLEARMNLNEEDRLKAGIGDVASLKFNINGQLRFFGKDLEIIRGWKGLQWVTDQVSIPNFNPNNPLSSELTLYPIDLPNFNDFRARGNLGLVQKDALEIPLNAFVQSEIRKKVRVELCDEGYQTEYLDSFGRPVKIGWCLNHPWPTTIQNSRYFAVLQWIGEEI